MRQSAFSNTCVQWGLSTIAGLCKDGIGRCLLAYSGGFEHSVQCHKHPKQISSVNGSNRPGAVGENGCPDGSFRLAADVHGGCGVSRLSTLSSHSPNRRCDGGLIQGGNAA